MGVSLKYVQRIEAGRQNLTIRTLVRVAAVLKVELIELFARPASTDTRVGRPKTRGNQADS
jgi:transcriptional regulator with XRE-family HTH domain